MYPFKTPIQKVWESFAILDHKGTIGVKRRQIGIFIK